MDTLDYQLKYKNNQEVLDLIEKAETAEQELKDNYINLESVETYEDEFNDMERRFDKLIDKLEDFVNEFEKPDDETAEKLQEIIDDA